MVYSERPDFGPNAWDAALVNLKTSEPVASNANLPRILQYASL
jgi:hypothetical protein